MRRKQGALVPIEVAILATAAGLSLRGAPEFHGFAVARELADREGARALVGHGRLYKALGRLEAAGFLTSRWEDPLIAAEERRPRRRLYRITAEGDGALARARLEATKPMGSTQLGLAPI